MRLPLLRPVLGAGFGFRRLIGLPLAWRLAAASLVMVALGAVESSAASNSAILARLAPHRAAYTMSFGQTRSGTGTVDARGVMLIEFKEACDGWTTTQRVHLDLINGEGDTVQTESNFSSWESKDSTSYRFTVKNSNGGKTTEEFQGTATLGSAGNKAVYDTQNKTYKLPAKTLFPTAHVAELIRRAEAGEKIFFNPFFDGATDDGPQDVNVVIGPPAAPAAKPMNPLLGRRSWPIRVAYFAKSDPKPDPEYEVGLRLYDNDVADAFVLDYGDFTVNAKLQKIEALPRIGC